MGKDERSASTLANHQKLSPRLMRLRHISRRVRLLSISCLVIWNGILNGCGLHQGNLKLKSTPLAQGVRSPLWLPLHIVMINERGGLIGVTKEDLGRHETSKNLLSPEWKDLASTNERSNDVHDYTYLLKMDEYFREILNHAKDFHNDTSECSNGRATPYPAPDGKRRLLLFVHGGLNSLQDTIDRSERLALPILCAGYYPIFVGWNSSLTSSLGEHLVSVRQGYLTGSVYGPVTAPFYFVSDALRSVGHLFQSGWQLGLNDLEGSSSCPGSGHGGYCVENPKMQETLREIFKEEQISKLEPPYSGPTFLGSLLKTLPGKMLLAPIMDGFGSGASDNMLRRTSVLFRADANFYPLPDGSSPTEPEMREPTGALWRFMQRLTQQIEADRQEDVLWDISLVGHSMGTIVLNKIIRDFGDELPVSNIVYMAAACTIRDYEESIWPYLKRRKHEVELREKCDGIMKDAEQCSELFPEKTAPTFYNLMLHPKAEAEDQSLGIALHLPMVPRGSLLVWLDGFLTNPATPLDLTLGRFANVTRTAYYTPQEFTADAIGETDSSINFTVCKKMEGSPQRHGDFTTNFKFWDSQCWKPRKECDPQTCWVEKQ